VCRLCLFRPSATKNQLVCARCHFVMALIVSYAFESNLLAGSLVPSVHEVKTVGEVPPYDCWVASTKP
jgi:hypothetical protein